MDTYEEKYKDLVKRLNKAREEKGVYTFNSVLDAVAPELKESEDERIRKEIKDFFSRIMLGQENFLREDHDWNAWIAWIEKQYKKDEEIILLKDKIESLESARIAMQECHRLELEKLEKQGEQKPMSVKDFQEEFVSVWHNASEKYPLIGKEIIVLRDNKIYYGKYIGGFHRYVRAELQIRDDNAETYAIIDYLTKKDKWIYVVELQNLSNSAKTCKDDQKPAEKVERKFKVGDWLVENEPNIYARFIQILEIVNVQGKDRYRISRDIHNDEDIVEFDFVEKYYHKFDIQDAKDGDILADDYGIYIFDKFDKCDKRCFLCIGAYQYSQKVYEDERMLCSIDVCPATKEQRDQLEKAMVNAGYTKPAIDIDIPFGAKDSELMEATYNISKGFHAEIDGNKVIIKKGEQKPAWSEQDEYNKRQVCRILRDAGCSQKLQDKINSWIESFRFQPHWKPSDEQIKSVKEAACYSSVFSEKTIDNLISLSKQLKKLRGE